MKNISLKNRIGLFIGLVVLTGVAVFVVGKLLEKSETVNAGYPATISQLDLDVDKADVDLIATSGNTVEVKRTDDYMFGKPSVNVLAQGTTLDIKHRCPTLRIGPCDSTFEILVPATVSIRVNGGNIDALGIRGDIQVESARSFSGSELFGKVIAETESGSIDLEKISSIDAKAKSKSGDVTLKSTAQPNNVDLETASGKITLRLPEKTGPYKIDATTETGKLTVELPNTPDSKSLVRVKSKSGDVDIRGS